MTSTIGPGGAPAGAEVFASAFASPGWVVWLDTAHQGRLTLAAAEALDTVREWKLHPEALATSDRYRGVVVRHIEPAHQHA